MLPTKKILLSWLKKQPLSGDYLWWRIASIIVVGAMAGSVLFSIWFIYHNIYTTISNASTIIFWESTPQMDAVDISAYEQAQKNLSLKSDIAQWPKNLRNIFDYGDITATTTAATYEKE